MSELKKILESSELRRRYKEMQVAAEPPYQLTRQIIQEHDIDGNESLGASRIPLLDKQMANWVRAVERMQNEAQRLLNSIK